MSNSAAAQDEVMRDAIQDGGYAVPGGRDLFTEVMDTAGNNLITKASSTAPHDSILTNANRRNYK